MQEAMLEDLDDVSLCGTSGNLLHIEACGPRMQIQLAERELFNAARQINLNLRCLNQVCETRMILQAQWA